MMDKLEGTVLKSHRLGVILGPSRRVARKYESRLLKSPLLAVNAQTVLGAGADYEHYA